MGVPCCVITQKNDALRLLKITPLTLITYLTLLENNYRPENTYHNSIHAADVTQSASVLLGVTALQVNGFIIFIDTAYTGEQVIGINLPVT